MTELAAIDVRGLEKKYQGGIFRKGFDALKGVDFSVNQGEVFGLLGPNGAGKTTLIKVLLGIVRSTGGNASVLGSPAGSKQARQRIGYLPENLSFPAHHTATRALQLYGRLSRVEESAIRERGRSLLQRVGLLGREREYVKRYSKGMRQRLGLAQALLHEPELMILDEPTDGLDPVGRSEIRQIIMEMKDEGKTVFLNSHILQEVELVCDRVAILAGGQLRGVGTPAELTCQFQGALSTKLRMELAGETEQIDALRSRLKEAVSAVGEETQCEIVALPDGRAQLTAAVEDHSQVDAIVDFAREAGLSIRHLQRSRLTLEEVFLSAVSGDSPVS
ncbi:MAG: ABC transporter ATP-binding protein [Aureliella sp.]